MANTPPIPTNQTIPIDEVVNLLSNHPTKGTIHLTNGRVVQASSRLTQEDMIAVAEKIGATFEGYKVNELKQIQEAVGTRLARLEGQTSTVLKRVVLWFQNKLAKTQKQQKLFQQLAEKINTHLADKVPGAGRLYETPSSPPLAGRGESPSAPSPSFPSPTRGSPVVSSPPSPLTGSGESPSAPSPTTRGSPVVFSSSPTILAPPPPPIFSRPAQPSKVHREFESYALLPQLPGEPLPPPVPEGYDLGELKTTRSSSSTLKALDQMSEDQRTKYAAQLEAYVKGLNQAIQKMEEHVEVRRLQALPEEIQKATEQLGTELRALKESRIAYEEAQYLSTTLPIDGKVVMQYKTAKEEQRSWPVVHEGHPDYKPFFALKHSHLAALDQQKALLHQATAAGIQVKDLQPSATTNKIEEALKQANIRPDTLAATPDQLAVRQEVIAAGLDPSKLDHPTMRGSMLSKDQAKRFEPSPSQRIAINKLIELGIKGQDIQLFTSHQNAMAEAKAMGLDVSIFDQVRALQQEIDLLKTAGVDVEAIFNHSIEQKVAYHQKEVGELERSYHDLRATLSEKMEEEATHSAAILNQHPYSEWTRLIVIKKKWAKDLASKAEQIKKLKGSATQESQGPSKKELAERTLATRYSSNTLSAAQELMSVEASDRNAALGGRALLQRARPPSPVPSKITLSEMINRGDLTLEELKKIYPTLEGEMKREATALLHPRLDFPANQTTLPPAEGGIPPPPPPPPPLPPRWT